MSLPTNAPELIVKPLETTGVEPVYETLLFAAVIPKGAFAIALVALLKAELEPAVLVAVTRAFRYFPTSAATSVYEDEVALEMSE